MTDIYHWVGSHETVPEFFELMDYKGNTMYPDEDALDGVYNMKERLNGNKT